MKLDRILLAPKLTGVEYDMHRFNLTLEDTAEFYRQRRLDPQRILDGHALQKENLARVAAALPGAEIVSRHELSKDRTKDADLVVSLGGDNHMTYVAHYTDAPILGLNSNPTHSHGVLLNFSCDRLDEMMEQLERDQVEVEEWPRIRVEIDGRPVESAITECYLGEQEPFFASYNMLRLGETTSVHRGSGTLVVNGAGSTGWYMTASRFTDRMPFARSDRRLRFLAREPFLGERYNQVPEGDLEVDERLEIVSNNDHHGILVCDSLVEFRFEFPAGSHAILGVDEQTTRILRPVAAPGGREIP